MLAVSLQAVDFRLYNTLTMSDDRNVFEKGADKAKEMGQDIKEGAHRVADKTKEAAHDAKCKMSGDKEKCGDKAQDAQQYMGDKLRGAARTVEGH